MTHKNEPLPHMPRCPQCCWDINLVGNEDYGENGNKYLYHCPHCGAEIEVYEPLDEDKPNYPYWR